MDQRTAQFEPFGPDYYLADAHELAPHLLELPSGSQVLCNAVAHDLSIAGPDGDEMGYIEVRKSGVVTDLRTT